ncbi:MAG TPA: hypothetical protein PK504_08150 [Ferruginibacter sp.]|nr:hypothetical protein [Ferruginibacter sp.]HRE64730.1 hypothetical protein [Ferruginibacter sp.]
MKILSTAVACILFIVANAQQYVIKYDIFKQKSNYYRVNKEDTVRIKNIDLKKNGRIMLELNNYNPFYWNAKVTAYKNPVDEEVGFDNAFNPISVLAGGLGGIMNGLPNLDLPKKRGNLTADGLDNATFNYLSTVENYTSNFENLQQVSDKLEELQTAKLQLKELKYDIRHDEAYIKSNARANILKVLGTDQLDVTSILKIGKAYNLQMQNCLQQAGIHIKNIQQQQKLVNPNTVFEDKTLKEIGEAAVLNYEGMSQLRKAAAQNPGLMLDEVALLAQLFNEINNASFKFSYAVKDQEDISDIKLELFPKADSISKDTIVQYFELSRRKMLRIRNSLGIAFTYFTANNRNFYVGSDSIIRSGKKDLFNPLLSTFIHFYAGKSGNVKWGGALGFGIPLTGEKKDINFLLGLSAALGKNEPILITAGAAGAKVNKLTNGYALGDKVNFTDASKLTTSGYDIGGFVSVSFNLSNLNLGKK